MNVYIFTGRFESPKASRAYTQQVWEPEPDESATEEEYRQWEDSNPRWRMKEDLGLYLDSDFIETINGADKFDYLKSMVAEPAHKAIEKYQPEIDDPASTLVLIFESAIQDKRPIVRSTKELTYCGKWPSTI